MTINISVPDLYEERIPRISVIGVGGGGGNAVNNMIAAQLNGVEFIVANTDAQSLAQSQAPRKIQLAAGTTRGLGAGSKPEAGRAAAEEAAEELTDAFENSEMVFIAAGMGGGTGTGAAPVIARLARDQGILTVGVATKPFQFEGRHRMRIAEAGIEELEEYVDTLIVIPNQNLFRIATEKTTFAEAFRIADDVLYSGVRNVTDLMMVPGLINLDFEDVRTVMFQMGKAVMGTGEAEGEGRDIAAAEMALSNPLLDDVSMEGARGVLINITGGSDLTLFEIDKAANRIAEEVDPESNTIFGSTLDPNLDGRIRVSIVATGMDTRAASRSRPPSPELAIVQGQSLAPAPEDLEEPRMAGLDMSSDSPREPEHRPVVAAREPADSDTNQVRPAATESTPPLQTTLPLAAEARSATPEVTAPGSLSPSVTDPEGTPSHTVGDAFIPPAPAEAAAKAPAASRAEGATMAETISETDGAATARRRSGFFERVKSGVKRDIRTGSTLAEQVAAEKKPPNPANAPATSRQRSLSGVDADDRIAQSKTENDHDMLQIPSFLRRQAN